MQRSRNLWRELSGNFTGSSSQKAKKKGSICKEGTGNEDSIENLGRSMS